jgi:hypothetical protein
VGQMGLEQDGPAPCGCLEGGATSDMRIVMLLGPLALHQVVCGA